MTDAPIGNWTWQAMEPADREALRPHMTSCHLPQGDLLMSAGDAVDVVYFPVSAEVANIVRLKDGKGAQAATVSRNGVTGLAAFLANEPLGWDLTVQIGGAAWRLPADLLRERCDNSQDLMTLLMSLTHENQIEASVNATCHIRHQLTPRIARWLLTTQERTGLSDLPVKQDDLADWMGVTRQSVVESCQALTKAGGIRTLRGRITIVSRDTLKGEACECYGRIDRRFRPHPETDAASAA